MIPKIFCAGHEIPNLDVIRRFYAIIDKYEDNYLNRDLLIGVHCTHGVNRTGYLVCRYLIERLGWKAEEALRRYSEARGHPIERKPYINDLYQTEKYPVFTEKSLTQDSLEEPASTKKTKDWRLFDYRVYQMSVSLAEKILSETFRRKYAEFLIPGKTKQPRKNPSPEETSALFEKLAKKREEDDLWRTFSSFNFWSTALTISDDFEATGRDGNATKISENREKDSDNVHFSVKKEDFCENLIPEDVFVVEGSLSDFLRRRNKEKKKALKKKRSKKLKRGRVESESSTSESTASEVSVKDELPMEASTSSGTSAPAAGMLAMQQQMFQMMAMQQYWMQQQHYYNAQHHAPTPAGYPPYAEDNPPSEGRCSGVAQMQQARRAPEAIAQAYHHKQYDRGGREERGVVAETKPVLAGAEEISSDESEEVEGPMMREEVSPELNDDEDSRDVSVAKSSNTGSTGTPDIQDEAVMPEEQTEEQREEITTSQKRRERRKRLKGMFQKMKKGNFWEIQEMQKEKYGS